MDPTQPLAPRVSWKKRGILLGFLALASLPRPALALPDDALLGMLHRINGYTSAASRSTASRATTATPPN